MFVGFHHARFDALAQIWNDCLPDGYAISPDILKANSVDCPVFDWGASVIDIDDDAKPLGFVVVKRSAAKLYHGPDPDQAHLSAVVCPKPKMAVEMLAFVKQNLKDRGSYKIVFGQDIRHFFAGCPSDVASLRDLLMIEGFEQGGKYYDVQQDLSAYKPDEKALHKLKEPEVQVKPIGHDQLPQFESFMKAEFPGRWTYDTAAKVKAESGCSFVYGLWVKKDMKGFALTQDEKHKFPISGAVFGKGLGAKWCTLGPIGVAKDTRGQGLGDALLTGALMGMKRAGKRNCLIDWTVLTDWYGKHGFKIYRTYMPFSLKLDEVELESDVLEF